jgi:hypothetical protein
MITVEEKDLRFYIAVSTQSNAGMGLFASQHLKRGDHLEVIGVMVNKGSISDECTAYANTFKFAADYADSYRKHIIPLGYGGMVNHANQKKDQNAEIKYITKGGRKVCVYQFIKDIEKDEEILGDYGEGWKSLSEWAESKVNGEQEEEETEWSSFLEIGLYNLGKLKK